MQKCVVVSDGAVDTKTDDALDEAVTRDAQRIFGGMPFERA